MNSYKKKVIKSESVNVVERKPSGAGSFSRADWRDAGTAAPSAAGESQDVLKRDFDERLRQAEVAAFERGLLEGLKKGQENERRESLKSVEAISTLLRDLTAVKQQLLDRAEPQVLALALAVAEKVLHTEVTTNRAVITSTLKAAMKHIIDRENIKVHLHPADYAYIMEIKQDFLQGFDGIKNIVFLEDDVIRRGGAVIETQFGEVDARVDQQFSEILDRLRSSDTE